MLTSIQFLPLPVPRMCTSRAAPGRGGREGMVSFGLISITSAMVVRVIWRVREHFCFRVYVKTGLNVYELK